MSESDDSRTGSQTVDRAARLLRFVCAAGSNGRQLSEIVKMSGLTKPTVRRLLIALIDNGFLEQSLDDRKYLAGPETYTLGLLAAVRFDIHRLARDSLLRIAAESEDTALLSIPRSDDTICIAREEGTYPLRSHVLQPGHKHPLGCGAPGIALLSCMNDKEIDAILVANAKRLASDYPRVTRDVVLRQVKNARKLGYALNEGLIFEGSWGIAVAVRDAAGKPVAALGIAGVEARFTKQRIVEMSRILKAEGVALERSLAELQA